MRKPFSAMSPWMYPPPDIPQAPVERPTYFEIILERGHRRTRGHVTGPQYDAKQAADTHIQGRRKTQNGFRFRKTRWRRRRLSVTRGNILLPGFTKTTLVFFSDNPYGSIPSLYYSCAPRPRRDFCNLHAFTCTRTNGRGRCEFLRAQDAAAETHPPPKTDRSFRVCLRDVT